MKNNRIRGRVDEKLIRGDVEMNFSIQRRSLTKTWTRPMDLM